MRYSIIITAAREEKTIAQALTAILDPQFSGFSSKDFELITIIPDTETEETAAKHIKQKFPKTNWVRIKDPYKGKPHALNLGFAKAKGEILILTDGDVSLQKNALGRLIAGLENNPDLGGVTGRPISVNSKHTFWGYIAHLLADGAHHKRVASMRRDIGGNSLKLVNKGPGFFIMSGYILAMRNLHINAPVDTLIEDAYYTYEIVNKGYGIGYVPDARVSVKYPANMKDWYNQKARSVGGYMQLHKFDIVKPGQKVRSFWKELEYFWFPITYAHNPVQLIWSLELYPLRLLLWLRIFYEQKVLKKDFLSTWVRIESTK